MIFILHNQWLLTILCHLGKIENYNCHCGKNSGEQKIKEKLMKKVLKIGVVLTTLVFGLVCLAACSDGEESRSVVAEYKDVESYTSSFIFYNDNTYELKAGSIVAEKGKYSGSLTTMGIVRIIQPSSLSVSGDYIPNNINYTLRIDKDGDELYLYGEDDEDSLLYIKI